ncbi:DNA replication/repair protein RecF [Alicyclobacillus tolerans]|uniref:DNA replication/repair protein RecF n=1 Tax=Alicyclobacillus tolerans TaxID=90970 RepID=UPI001F01F0BD|nr:DNA replication/repair protein RecF [Alicyclobacillus tolerans]MCF8565716.1 DNA replication/repair protein RecF [Alicyclobacillus tolerans]
MFIKDLTLHNFRNYTHQEVSFGNELNLFVGENAQGKTNALEAIYLLAMGKSHRTQKDAELMMWQQQHTLVRAAVQTQQREIKLQIDLSQSGKRAQVNGVNQTKMTDFVGHFQVVLFAPEDLQLVKGGPSLRRRFMDMELGQTKPRYLYHLGQYMRSLQQRNSLLKQDAPDWAYVEVFEEQLVEHGVYILSQRLRFVEQIEELAKGLHDSISNGGERFSLDYSPSVPSLNFRDFSPQSAQPEEFAEALRSALKQKRNTDRRLGYTTTGPHRDDLVFFLDGQPVHSFASQGQQRTIALSLRLAEIDFIHREIGEYPVLLLDDVLSELDDTRQKNLILSMSERVQTILTTTSLFQLNDKLDKATRLFYVRSGIIQ